MPARRTARWAVPGAAALIMSCAVLAGCGSSGGSSPSAASAPSSGGSSPSAGNASAHNGKLTGNFCNDLKNIGKNIPIPPANASDPAAIQRRNSRYLNQVVAYYNKLASEAPERPAEQRQRQRQQRREYDSFRHRQQLARPAPGTQPPRAARS